MRCECAFPKRNTMNLWLVSYLPWNCFEISNSTATRIDPFFPIFFMPTKWYIPYKINRLFCCRFFSRSFPHSGNVHLNMSTYTLLCRISFCFRLSFSSRFLFFAEAHTICSVSLVAQRVKMKGNCCSQCTIVLLMWKMRNTLCGCRRRCCYLCYVCCCSYKLLGKLLKITIRIQ